VQYVAGKTTISSRPGGNTMAMHAEDINVGRTERVISAVAGGALVAYGLRRMSMGGLIVAAAGGALAYRALRGHSYVYDRLGIDVGGARRNVGNLGVKIDESIVVNAPPPRVYAVWRNLDNLPRLLSHVERVEVLDRNRSRWTVKGPAGARVSWDAELINDKPGELIAWRTTDSTLVNHAGSVTFEPAGEGKTRVRVSLQYDPPGGRFGHAVASLVSADAGSQVANDLAEFKRALEEGWLAA
jgi:uncharacterized membrane protein